MEAGSSYPSRRVTRRKLDRIVVFSHALVASHHGRKDMADEAAKYVELTSDIVAAYVSTNHAQIEELPSLIASVHGALQQAATGATATEKPKPEPVVPPNKSVRPDHIVCLFDGKKFKSLKRHIRVSHGMTPQQYREAFDLRQDYPMVAPAYASARSELAKGMGFGLTGKKAGGSKAAALKRASTVKAKRSKQV
jgi:predicted transcriptional regulator